jgi:choline dehydrogenase-like flavoprotein
MCLYGCPYGLIFNAADAVDRMVRSGGLTYRPGFHAIRFEERGDGVRVCSARETVSGDRLYVACGVLSTAMLSLRSLGALGQRVTLKDSQYFFLPMLQRRGSGDPSREPRHTLAQMFWEIINPDVNPQTVHVQLYTYNDTYAPDMKRRFGFLAHMLGPMTEMLSRRLIVAQGFLHSDSSHRIVLRLEGGHGSERLVYEAGQNSATASAIVRASRAVSRVGRLGGLLPLPPLLRTGSLGSSFHCGGSFPMSASPNGLDSDVLGRPGGLRRIHIVDASVFPSIPATTITFSVMANAHRIASLA